MSGLPLFLVPRNPAGQAVQNWQYRWPCRHAEALFLAEELIC